MRKFSTALSILACLLVACSPAGGEQVGSVDTVFQWLGPTTRSWWRPMTTPRSAASPAMCRGPRRAASRAGWAWPKTRAEASIACRQTGPITFPTGKPLDKQEEMFSERISLVFKRLRVVRMVDARRNTLVYLTYSDRVIEGSPQNSVTAVPLPPGTVVPLK
jgi:CreA protein